MTAAPVVGGLFPEARSRLESLDRVCYLDNEIVLRFHIIGISNVGKTALVRKYDGFAKHKRIERTEMTDVTHKVLSRRDKTLKLQIHDVPGQTTAESSQPQFFRDCCGALCITSLSDPVSFEGALKWRAKLREHWAGSDYLPILLIANKSDVRDPCMTDAELEAFARTNGFDGWYKSSAEKDPSVDHIFVMLCDLMLAAAVAAKEATSQMPARRAGPPPIDVRGKSKDSKCSACPV